MFIQYRIGDELGVDPKAILATSHGRRSIDTLALYDKSKANWECMSIYFTHTHTPEKKAATNIDTPNLKMSATSKAASPKNTVPTPSKSPAPAPSSPPSKPVAQTGAS
jgi:glycerol-1-phosphatase